MSSDARTRYLIEEAISSLRVLIEELQTELRELHTELHNAQTKTEEKAPVRRTGK